MASSFCDGFYVRINVGRYVFNFLFMETVTLERMNLDHKIRDKVMSSCFDKGFYVIQVPMGRGWSKKPYPVQLQMDLQGQLKMGEDSYEQNSEKLSLKINEMYLYMFKNFVN
jgi:hypothetical protein